MRKSNIDQIVELVHEFAAYERASEESAEPWRWAHLLSWSGEGL
jgi:hypothetical protein